ncbi:MULTISPECIES: uridine kinase [unclassified Isoptericola]|uniref:uridine kinase family protein n=1 Tax=unclassified Isoptericola TaxID=2623355 RepID=UPI0027132454|nr:MULTISPECIES: ATP-binding protein [unclassified Isoptericola]MDO8143317.1 ATP-binding protein [Isoptericola sp. 178]MDO8147177.1 ATP-binding protein [Isoptericola sp. b515]MDO8150507.1 ATP-binding protein [Isoptericola sp. b408]
MTDSDLPASARASDALFDVPAEARRPITRIVLLTGASGSGKSALTRRLGLPVVMLDDFYRDHDHPGMPRAFGIVDWDDPASWDHDAALEALRTLAATGRTEVPVYDIPTSRRTGDAVVDAHGEKVVLAEGVFAAELVADLRAEGILADAICLARPRLVTFWFRLLRDLAESRKPPFTLLRRGWGLMRAEPELVRRWTELGCRPLTPSVAEQEIRSVA